MTFNLLMTFTLLHYYTIIALDINTYILIYIYNIAASIKFRFSEKATKIW